MFRLAISFFMVKLQYERRCEQKKKKHKPKFPGTNNQKKAKYTDPVCLERHFYLLISRTWYSNSRSIRALIVHPHSVLFGWLVGRWVGWLLCVVPSASSFSVAFSDLIFSHTRHLKWHFFAHSVHITEWHGFSCASVKWSFQPATCYITILMVSISITHKIVSSVGRVVVHRVYISAYCVCLYC